MTSKVAEGINNHSSPADKFSSIPSVLRIKNNWCVHKKDGERPKIPHHPDGYKMAWSISANWVSFISARDAYLKGLKLPETNKRRFDGIGFFIAREKDAKLDIYAIDLDKCRNIETGELDQWARDLLNRINSYSELSPSGTGVHVFVKGMLPAGSKNTNDQMKDKNRVEVFVDKHHITMTGDRLKEYPASIEDRSEIIADIYNEVLKVKEEKKEAARKAKIKTKRVIYDGKEEAKKKYVAAAIEDEIQILKTTSEGGRNNQLNKSAFAIGQFVGARCISRGEAERELKRAARACGMDEGKDGVEATIRSGLDDGELHPRDIPDPDEIKPTTAAFSLPQITVIPAPAPEKRTVAAPPKTDEKISIATQLVNLAIKNSFERWHTPDNEPYITVAVNSHREHYRISTKSNLIKAWIGRLGRDILGKTPSVSSIRDAINNLVGIAIYDGPEHRLYVRKAEIDGKIYIDLGDSSWSIVEVSEDGWRIVENSGIYFRRSKNMLPLPIPERGGEIEDLRKIINAKTDESWILTLAWLTQAFWCRGPYAHLYLRGTQGTAKSYMMQALKSISDPSAAIKRRLPKTERDAAIALGSESIPCFDNMSGVSDDIADLLCVASTGGVSSQRALFTDDEEAIIFVKCPIVANGIDDIGQRGDLLDRTIVIDLEPIPESERKTEKEMQKAIDENRSKLFGCLLDMTSQGLSDIDSVDLEEAPRMADFAEWAYACLGNTGDKFIEAYLGSREEIKHDLVEANAFPRAVRKFAKLLNGIWTGTASELLDLLNKQEYIREGYEPAEWPRTANQLGSELRRHVPDLEISGVMVKFSKSHKKARAITISYEQKEEPPKDDGDGEDKGRPPKTDSKDDGDKGDNVILEEEEEDIIRGVVGEVPSKTKFSLPQKRRPLVPLDPDSDFKGTTVEDNTTKIKMAAILEWGQAGWVDPNKIAAKLHIPLDEVIQFFESENSGYIPTESRRGYIQKGINRNHDHQTKEE